MKIGNRSVRRYLFPRSLKFQLLSRSSFIIAGLLFLIGVLQFVLVRQFLYRNQASTLENEIHSLPGDIWQQIDNSHGVLKSDDQAIFSMQTHGAAVAFIDRKGNFYAIQAMFDPDRDHVGNPPRLPTQTYTQAMSLGIKVQKEGLKDAPTDYKITKDDMNRSVLVVLAAVPDGINPIGVVQVSVFVEPLQHVLFEQLFIFILLALGAVISGFLTMLPVLRKTLTPLSKMVETVGRINAGNLDERFSNIQSQTEIELLSHSFNDMLERLEGAFRAEREAKERMRQFIADASHELRTPLTSMHGFLEVLLRGAKTNPDQLERALRSMYGESERINKLVDNLLLLARLDREPTYDTKEGTLDTVIHEMEPQLRLLAKDRRVEFDLQHGVFLNFSADQIKQVILNLFQNAVQHTDPLSGVIRVSLQSLPTAVRLSVEDNGPGIPIGHQARLFQRFYRVDSARSRKHGGSGLGLAITKSIVENHGGTIDVVSEAKHGTTFRIHFPRRLQP